MFTNRHRRLGSYLAVALVATLVGACAGGAGGTSPNPTSDPSASPSTPPTTDEIVLPSDPDALVLQVGQEGGFTTPDYQFGRVPTISVYADGRVIEQGAQIAIYPGPLLPALFVAQIPLDRVKALVAAAVEAGLGSGTNATYPATSVADAPDTVIVVRAPAGLTRTSFGAFGMEQMGLSATETEARAKAGAFLATLPTSAYGTGELPASEPYVPSAARILARPYTNQAPDLPQQEVDWPLSSSIATGGVEWIDGQPELGRCIIVEGQDLTTLWSALTAANGLTPFVSDGAKWALTVRPLLPDEEPICP